MKRRSFLKYASLCATAAGLTAQTDTGLRLTNKKNEAARPSRSSAPGVKTILSFATEAAHAPEDPDFIMAIAEFLTAEKLVGNFHVTGDYARALKRRGRLDVVEALEPHEIGFHCNHHGSHPWMAGYLEKYPWAEGLSRWLSYEAPGFAVVGELFNRRPCYYTTEFAKAPQTNYGSALMGAGIMGYVGAPARGHSAIWFCNSLVPTVENIVALESFHAPGDREKVARTNLDNALAKQKALGKDVLRVFLHSYKYYAEPPYDRLTQTLEIYKRDDYYFEDYPGDYVRQAPEQFKESFERFKRTIRYHRRNSEFVTFSQYRNEYREIQGVWIDLPEIDGLCQFLERSLDAYSTVTLSLSPAEAFGVLIRVLRTWHETGHLPTKAFVRTVIGPLAPIPEQRADVTAKTSEILKTLAPVDRELDMTIAVPQSAVIAGSTVGPGQLLRGLVKVYLGIRTSQRVEEVVLAGADLPEIAKEPYFLEKGFTRKGLYPDDFTGKNICAMSRVQSWSWKPAVRL